MLINLKKNILKIIKTGKVDSLLQLILLITFKCNLRCAHCFFKDDLNKGKVELDFNEYKKILDKISKIENLSIGGGEPFIRADLRNIVELFSEKSKNITIVTNGFFSQKIYEFVESVRIDKKCNLNIFISLDGDKQLHTELRNNKESYDKVIRTCQLLNNSKERDKIRLVVHTNISSITIRGIKQLLVDVKEKINPDNHTFELVRNLPELFPGKEELENCIYLISEFTGKNYYNDIGKIDKFKKLFKNDLLKYFMNVQLYKAKPTKCFADKYAAVVYPDGNVSFCEGILTNIFLKDIDYDLKRLEVHQEVKEKTNRIRNCFCTHACFQPYNVFLSPRIFLNMVQG
jgi:MoaA/NifB/PqqE/SkfB family radical SAM enzyme